MPLFIGDHLAETSDFDTLENGAYLLLLMRWWQSDGSLPNDDKYLAKVARLSSSQWQRIKLTVMRPFYLNGGGYGHKRMSSERQKAHDNIEKRRLAGIASGKARREHMFNGCSSGVRTHVEPRAGDGDGPVGRRDFLSMGDEDIFE